MQTVGAVLQLERGWIAADRNARVVLAVRDHGYTMREVAECLGRHYATISRVLARAAGMSPCRT